MNKGLKPIQNGLAASRFPAKRNTDLMNKGLKPVTFSGS